METVSSEIVAATGQPRGRLLRILGVSFGLAVTIGGVIGMGILRTPGDVATQLPRPWLFIGVWLIGGLYALLGTINVAELGAMVPQDGGFYVYARRAFGPYVGFVIGWSDWLSTCGTTAAVALVIGEYTVALFPVLDGREVLIALLATTGFAVLQWLGVRWGGRTQEITSLIKTLALFALVTACFILGKGQPAANGVGQTASTDALVSFALLSGMIRALQGVIYTYDGWYNVIYFGEEVRDPGRNIPRSMIGSMFLVTGIYILINLALLYVLPLSQIAGQKLAVGAAANVLFGSYGGTLIAALATISMLSTVNANSMIAPRIMYAMSRDGLISEKAVKVNRGGTPSVTLLLSTLAALLFIVFSKRLETVFAVLAFFFVINYGVTFLSVIILRRKEPDMPRPYRAWGYPFTTILVILGSIAFLVGAYLDEPQHGIYVLILLAVSYPAFRLLKLFSGKTGDSV